MAVRIPWDKQETALLIDAYVRVKNKKLSQQEAIKEVSLLLRRRAIHSGMQIDDVFRNINGITMQMKIVGGLLDGRSSGLHSASKMFNDMVTLYKNDSAAFNEILLQAKGECAMQGNVQEKFFAWLAARISSAQLSEYYIVCKDIESYCMEKHIITKPLFETTNTVVIQGIIDIIKTNRMFQFKYFRQLGKMRKVMDYYMKFLMEISLKESKVIDKIPVTNRKYDEISEKYNEIKSTKFLELSSEQKMEVDCREEDTQSSIEDMLDVITSNGSDEEIQIKDCKSGVWNFANNNIDFFKIFPVSISYFGEEEKVQGWADAFTKIIYIMQEDYPSIIRGIVGYRFGDIGKLVLTSSTGISSFKNPVKLNSGLYLETDCSPDEIVSIVRTLMDKCNVDYDNIEICYEETKGDVTKTEIRQTYDAIVTQEVSSNKGVQDYIVQILDNLNVPYIDYRNNDGCLWIIGDYSLSPIFERFYQYDVVFQYKEEGGRATKGESAWWTKDVINIDEKLEEHNTVGQLVEEDEKTLKESVMNASVTEKKVEFENWIITDLGLSAYSAQSYSSAINVAGQYCVRLGFSKKELFYIQDAKLVYQISMKLLANSEFAQINDKQHNRYRAALSKYWDYCKHLSGDSIVTVPIKDVSTQEDKIKQNRIDFITWAQNQQMQMAEILAYLSYLKKCSEFFKECNYIKEEHILLIKDSDIIEQIFQEMRKDCRFLNLSNEKQKCLISAMNKLIKFRRNTTVVSKQTITNSVSTVSSEKSLQRLQYCVNPMVKERYKAILSENFVDGFRPEKAIDRNRFKMYYSDLFGDELTEDDEQLVQTLLKVGTLRDDRIFVKDETEQKDLIEEINDTITEAFENGASCIYLDCLFLRFQEQLSEMLHIYNVNSLEKVLFSAGKRKYFKRYNYLFGYNKEPSPNGDVIDYMKESHLPVTYSEIEKKLWYIPLDKIKNILVTTSSIVNVASEAYLYAPNLPVSQRELQQISELISNALLQSNYISDVELMQLIEEYCPSVLMNTPDYPLWGIRNALAYLLCDKFSFRGAIISEKDAEISMAEVFTEFCQRTEHITVDELKQFANELNTVIYWDSVYSEMVRVNQSEFIHKNQISFNIDQIDKVLENLIQSLYVPLKSINLFLHFPTIDVPWNNFVLESYVAHYSRKFKLLHASYAATDCCGAIVRRDAGICDYRTLIVDVLAKNTGWKNKKDALQLLVDFGYQQRRSYSDIEKVMQEAKAKLQMQKK